MQRYMQNEHNKVTETRLEDDLAGDAIDVEERLKDSEDEI